MYLVFLNCQKLCLKQFCSLERNVGLYHMVELYSTRQHDEWIATKVFGNRTNILMLPLLRDRYMDIAKKANSKWYASKRLESEHPFRKSIINI